MPKYKELSAFGKTLVINEILREIKLLLPNKYLNLRYKFVDYEKDYTLINCVFYY